jgi:hypothetical protein
MIRRKIQVISCEKQVTIKTFRNIRKYIIELQGEPKTVLLRFFGEKVSPSKTQKYSFLAHPVVFKIPILP